LLCPRRAASTEISSRRVSASSKAGLAEVRVPADVKGASPYAAAKRAENEQDLTRALELYRIAVSLGDKTESAVKDAAGLLHALGRSGEAVTFLTAHEDKIVDKRAYQNLLGNLRRLFEGDETDTPDYLRTVELRLRRQVHATQIGRELCERLFKNSARIRRIVVCGHNGFRGLVEFASHSAARKALQHLEGHHTVEVRWAWPEARTSLLAAHGFGCPTAGLAKNEGGGSAAAAAAAAASKVACGAEVHYWPEGCWSAADLGVFHLLPQSLWRELCWADSSDAGSGNEDNVPRASEAEPCHLLYRPGPKPEAQQPGWLGPAATAVSAHQFQWHLWCGGA